MNFVSIYFFKIISILYIFIYEIYVYIYIHNVMGQSPFGNRPIAHIYTSEIAPAWKKKPELDPRDGKNSTEKLQKLRHLKPPPPIR